ncbi:12212_t:CDS:2 [Rhizophagus irregularis]|nr:12212_t:CDS:2 [Rhizophagus irregularis]
MATSTSSSSVLGDKHDNLSTTFADEPKPIKDTLIDPTKELCGDKEDQQHVKFVKRRRTPYAWDDKLRPVFDDDDKKKADKNVK